MRIGELPVGARLIFGTYNDDDIRWVKVSENSDFFAETRTGVLQYDNVEDENVSRARRRFGNNFFPHSNIAQWLNAKGDDWFQSAHPHDYRPRYCNDPGFLTGFTQRELDSLDEREITIAVPLGSRKEFGKAYKTRFKVCLPSASEIGYESSDISCEGELLTEISDYLARSARESVMTRTGVKDGGHILSYYGTIPEEVIACRSYGVHPMIRIKPDTEVSNVPDSAGYFYMPDTELLTRFLEILSFE